MPQDQDDFFQDAPLQTGFRFLDSRGEAKENPLDYRVAFNTALAGAGGAATAVGHETFLKFNVSRSQPTTRRPCRKKKLSIALRRHPSAAQAGGFPRLMHLEGLSYAEMAEVLGVRKITSARN